MLSQCIRFSAVGILWEFLSLWRQVEGSRYKIDIVIVKVNRKYITSCYRSRAVRLIYILTECPILYSQSMCIPVGGKPINTNVKSVISITKKKRREENKEWQGRTGKWGDVVFDRLLKEGIYDEVTFKLRP